MFPVIVLWTTPRSRSTAFERMMIERGDHTVLDEPFSARYYFSTERRSRRFGEQEPGATADAVLAGILEAARSGPVFVKDMAYHLSGAGHTGILEHFTNTFLVREPAAALASLARKWPDFTDEEAGYDALGDLFDTTTRVDPGRAPVVLDADELSGDPKGHIERWCDALGIAYRPDALSWEPGMVPQWTRWRDWYAGVAESSGFVDPREHRGGEPSRRPATAASDPALVARCRNVYERMAQVRLRP